jgi:peroxiredoxin
MLNSRGFIMKIQASLWIVTAVMVLAVGLVYALSITPSPSRSVSIPASFSTPEPSPSALAEKPLESLSPVLTQTDAYEFLDPIPVGKKAPDFTAKTADGKVIHLSDFKNKKNLVLVFYQGSFCSVCGHQLANIQENKSHFNAQDAVIIAVSADDQTHALNSLGEHGLTFNVVPDPDKKLIKSFGVSNISKNNIAWPSLFVVDKQGIVRLSFANREGQRLHSQEILPVLAKITGKPAPHLSGE